MDTWTPLCSTNIAELTVCIGLMRVQVNRFTKGCLACNSENQKWSKCPTMDLSDRYWQLEGGCVLTFPSPTGCLRLPPEGPV